MLHALHGSAEGKFFEKYAFKTPQEWLTNHYGDFTKERFVIVFCMSNSVITEKIANCKLAN